LKSPWQWLFVLVFVGLLVVGALVPPGGGMPPSYGLGSRAMEQSRAIYALLMAYADNHRGAFPTGRSSTEIFQKLVEENHFIASGMSRDELYRQAGYEDSNIHDTAIFYLKVPGKSLATSTVLKPENVCFDVTIPLGREELGACPMVFLTGYRVQYVPNGKAVCPDASQVPSWSGISYSNQVSISVWDNRPAPPIEGLPARPYFLPDHSIANFVPADFDAKGVKYVQLTPDGPLP
jgi:hypothetical protein